MHGGFFFFGKGGGGSNNDVTLKKIMNFRNDKFIYNKHALP